MKESSPNPQSTSQATQTRDIELISTSISNNTDADSDSDFFIDDEGASPLDKPSTKLKINYVKEFTFSDGDDSENSSFDEFIPQVIYSKNIQIEAHTRSVNPSSDLTGALPSATEHHRIKGQFREGKSTSRLQEEEELLRDYLDNISDPETLFNMSRLQGSLRNASSEDDDDSDDGLEDWTPMSTKNHKLTKSKGVSSSMKLINTPLSQQLRSHHTQFQNFIRQKDINSMPLSPLKKDIHQKVVLLCKLYNLRCQNNKGGKKKYLIISKTPQTRNITEERFKEFCISLQPIQMDLSVYNSSSKNRNKKLKTAKPSKPKSTKGNQSTGPPPKSDPEKPIDEANKGHKLLSKLGWTPGTSIGANNTGILNPIEAIKIKGRTGLGFDS